MSCGYITNGTSQDGFGARLLREITTMAFTFYLQDKFNANVEYIHTPYTFEGFENFGMPEMVRSREIGDNGEPYNEISREGYLNRAILWENRLSYSGISITDINLNNFEFIDDKYSDFYNRLLNDISLNKTDNKLYYNRLGLRNEFNNGLFDVNMVDTYYPKIKERYRFINPNINNDIMIHIRRKDAIADYHRATRYLNDEYYLTILQALIPFRNKYNITIFTQRKNFDFNRYSGWNIIYDDQEQDYDSLVKMVHAKVLVAGTSSFSIVAGFLNQNTVVYPIWEFQSVSTRGLNRFINKGQFIELLNNNKI